MSEPAVLYVPRNMRAQDFNRLCGAGGLAIWLGCLISVSVVIALSEPGSRSVAGVFHAAAEAWWHSRSPYTPDDLNGFLYLPQSAIIFTPFHLMGDKPGDIAWLWVRGILLASAVWRFIGLLSPPNFQGRIFLLVSALTMFSAAGNYRNAQFNIMLTALMLHAAATLAGHSPRRWIAGAAILTLGVAIKPLAIVHLLLNAGVWPRIWLPLAGAFIVAAALPFIHPSPEFVWHQYAVAFQTMGHAAQPPLDRFNDLRATLHVLQIDADPIVLTWLRGVMALAILAVLLQVRSRLNSISHAWLTVALASAYIMLFNPRTEGLTYVVLVVPLAIAGTSLIHLRPSRVSGAWFGWVLCLYSLLLGLAHVVGGNSWLRPTATIPLMLFLLVAPLFDRGRRILEIPAA